MNINRYTFPQHSNFQVRHKPAYNQQQQRDGKVYLVYTAYPNGVPIKDVKKDLAKDVIGNDKPGTVIDDRHLVFGRVKVKGVDVGTVVYPITEADFNRVQSTVATNKNDPFKVREFIDNKIIPSVIEKDLAKGGEDVVIFDMSQNRTLLPHELKRLNNGETPLDKLTTYRGKPINVEKKSKTNTREKGKLRQNIPKPLYPYQVQRSKSKSSALAIPTPKSVSPPYQGFQKVANLNSVEPSLSDAKNQNPFFKQPTMVFPPLKPGQHAPPFPGLQSNS